MQNRILIPVLPSAPPCAWRRRAARAVVRARLAAVGEPTRGTGNGIMETIRNYGYDIIMLVALLVVASMFIGVLPRLTAPTRKSTGRKTWGQFGLTVAIGAVLLVIGIWLLTEATGIPPKARPVCPSNSTSVRTERSPSFRTGSTAIPLSCAASPPTSCGSAAACLAPPNLLVGAPLILGVPHDRHRADVRRPGRGLGVFIGGGILRRLKRGRPTPGCIGNCMAHRHAIRR